MNKIEYKKFQEGFFEECAALSDKKNADYTGDGDSAFSNFESVERLHVDTASGFITRMNDKLMRIASFAKNGDLLVKDESVMDTLIDLANYSCLMAGWLESKNTRKVK